MSAPCLVPCSRPRVVTAAIDAWRCLRRSLPAPTRRCARHNPDSPAPAITTDGWCFMVNDVTVAILATKIMCLGGWIQANCSSTGNDDLAGDVSHALPLAVLDG